MNSISFSETLSNTLDMVSEWPKKHSYEPYIPTNLLFFTIKTTSYPVFITLELHFIYKRAIFIHRAHAYYI